MDERVLRFRVGVVVIAAAVITGILIMLLGEGRAFFQRRYTIFLRFPQAPGVTVDTPVRKHGVLIGRVAGVQLLEEGGVLLSVWIDARYRLRRSEVCRISTSSLLGDAVLEFVPKGEGAVSKELIQEGDLLADGIVTGDPLKVLTNLEGNVQSTIQSIDAAADQVAMLARNLNLALEGDQGQFQRLVHKSELALDTFRATMAKVDELLGDPELKASLKRSLADLPALFSDVRTTMNDAQKALAGFQRATSKAEENLDNLQALTAPLAERGTSLAKNIDAAVENLDTLMGQLVEITRAINNKQGSLGQLVYDQTIYQQLQRSVANIEDATRRIRPIMDDVRTFTDKIATDPRQLGLKGALDRRPLGIGSQPLPP